MKNESIARVAHEINRADCEQIGAVPPKPKRALPASGLVYVKYSGRKTYADKTPHRNVWATGDVKPVPVAAAEALLKFVEFEVIEKPKTEDAVEEVALTQQANATKDKDEQDTTNAILMTIDSMEKGALEEYARKYEVELDKRRSVATLRDEVRGLIEQFGAR